MALQGWGKGASSGAPLPGSLSSSSSEGLKGTSSTPVPNWGRALDLFTDGAGKPISLSLVGSWEGAFSLVVRAEHDRPIFMPQALVGWSESTSVAYKRQTVWRFYGRRENDHLRLSPQGGSCWEAADWRSQPGSGQVPALSLTTRPRSPSSSLQVSVFPSAK